MTTYNSGAVADAVIAFQKGITLQQGRALRDNPIAMFEGAAGAPRLQFGALDAAFSTAGGIGSYVWGRRNTAGDIATGATVAGSTLVPTGAFQSGYASAGSPAGMTSGSALTGTWRCMGYYTYSNSTIEGATLWLRIA